MFEAGDEGEEGNKTRGLQKKKKRSDLGVSVDDNWKGPTWKIKIVLLLGWCFWDFYFYYLY